MHAVTASKKTGGNLPKPPIPRHLKAMARFTLATGLRQGNVKGLRWSQVDLDRRIAWIYADQAKARKAIAVPLSAEAMKVLEAS